MSGIWSTLSGMLDDWGGMTRVRAVTATARFPPCLRVSLGRTVAPDIRPACPRPACPRGAGFTGVRTDTVLIYEDVPHVDNAQRKAALHRAPLQFPPLVVDR